jgi:hypothetical protein
MPKQWKEKRRNGNVNAGEIMVSKASARINRENAEGSGAESSTNRRKKISLRSAATIMKASE